jgi:SAM-dependent methyltransferase
MKLRHASKFGVITLRHDRRNGTLTYQQKGGNQTAIDADGVSLDVYVHALYGLVRQAEARAVLMIGCGGGTLATMLAHSDVGVTVVDIDKVSISLARRYFGMPTQVRSHVGDGFAFMRKTRRRFDAVVLDAFIGEDIPDHMRGETFYAAVERCLCPGGVALVNVCLAGRFDRAADRIAQEFSDHGWPVRLLDEPGGERNAIVLAGAVEGLKRPRMLMPPRVDAKSAARRLRAMRFRRPKRGLAER